MKSYVFLLLFAFVPTVFAQQRTAVGRCPINELVLPPVERLTPQPSQKFVPFQELKAQADDAMNRAFNRLAEEVGLEAAKKPTEENKARFSTLVREEFKRRTGIDENFHFLDTAKAFGYTLEGSNSPAPVNANIKGTVPRDYTKLFVTDHHKGAYGDYFDPTKPKYNTTMQVLDFFEQTLKDNGGDIEKAAAQIKSRYGVLTTDNLADAVEPILMIEHPQRFLADPNLRNSMRVASYFIDFGVFGGKNFEGGETKDYRSTRSVLQKVFPGREFTDEEITNGLAIGKAVLQSNSNIIADKANGIFAGDRINLLLNLEEGQPPFPPIANPIAQRRLIDQQIQSVARIIDEPATESPSYRDRLVTEFEAKRKTAATQAADRHTEFNNDLRKIDMATKVPGRLNSGPGSRSAVEDQMLLDAVKKGSDKYYFYSYGVDPKKDAVGQFAAWAAPGTHHNRPYSLSVTAVKKDNERPVTAFVFSNIDNREIPGVNLTQFGDQIGRIHLKNFESDLRSDNPTMPDAEIKKRVETESENIKRTIGGRDILSFNFAGLRVSPERLAMEAEAFIGANKPKIVDHLYRTGAITDRERSPENFFSTPVAFDGKIRRPRMVLMVGPPGSGKSTWASRVKGNSDWVVISKDEIRTELLQEAGVTDVKNPALLYTPEMDVRSEERLQQKLKDAIEAKKSVVVDTTNLTAASRAPALGLASSANYRSEALVFEGTPEANASNIDLRVRQGGTDLRDASRETRSAILRTIMPRLEPPTYAGEPSLSVIERVQVPNFGAP